jgi:FkbM family methyltransferase
MTFTSYAANFEDVLLWRALRHAPPGCYLDVGAGDPRAASATQALYERGWRGINLEPAPGLLRRLRIARPADVNLGIGAAATAGEAAFYEVPDSGDSTFDAARAEALGAVGRTVVLRRVPVDTLDAILAAHPLPALHLLKIGADAAAVLQGFDLRRWQPWIVLVDGAADGAVVPALAAAGFVPAHANGRSVFYVPEHRADLRAALALPPHPADDFVLSEGHHYAWPLDEWRGRTAAAEAAAEEARTWAQAHVREWREKYARFTEQEQAARRLQGELDVMTQRAATTEARLGALQARSDETAQRLAATSGELAATAQELAATRAELEAVVASASWRLTIPLREANLLRARAQRAARRAGAFGVRVAKAVLRRALHFVLARPKLAFFLRRQVARHPRLVQLARRVLLRSHETPASATAAPMAATAPGELPDAALRVLRDLRRAQR